MTTVKVAPGTIQVWSDLLCPFAYVAVLRLTQAREELGLTEQVRLDHHSFALELFNGPHSRPGTDTEAVGLGQIEPSAGFRVWTAPEWTYPSSVLLAAEAVHAAKDQGLRASEELDLALRRAFWTRSRSIGHRQVILEEAEGILDVAALAEVLDNGTHRAKVFADHEIAQSDQVTGSPHLFFADGTDAHNPGITVHWEGPFAEGYPIVDKDEKAWLGTALRACA